MPNDNWPSGHAQTAKAQIDCVNAQSDQDLCCLLLELLDTLDCINGQKRPQDLAHAQDNVNPHILCMLEGTFLLDVAHTFCIFIKSKQFCQHSLMQISESNKKK